VLVNRQEVFRRRVTKAVTVEVARVVAQLCAATGVVAGFWHIRWIAGVAVLVSGLVGIGVHSAGYVRLEFKEPGDPEPGAPG
jgi:pseudouridine-5'-phosphate glycosidase